MTPDTLARIHAACFPHAPWDANSFADMLAQHHTRVFVGDNGFLLARIIEPEAEILTLAVHPDTRRNGVAAGLVGQLQSQADTVFLDVAADNTGAIALYASCGFARTGRRAAYYSRADSPPVDAVLMSWSLQANDEP